MEVVYRYRNSWENDHMVEISAEDPVELFSGKIGVNKEYDLRDVKAFRVENAGLDNPVVMSIDMFHTLCDMDGSNGVILKDMGYLSECGPESEGYKKAQMMRILEKYGLIEIDTDVKKEPTYRSSGLIYKYSDIIKSAKFIAVIKEA